MKKKNITPEEREGILKDHHAGMTDEEIAQKYDRALSTIKVYIYRSRTKEMELRRELRLQRNQEIFNLRMQGMTFTEISQIVGLSPTMVNQICKKLFKDIDPELANLTFAPEKKHEAKPMVINGHKYLDVSDWYM